MRVVIAASAAVILVACGRGVIGGGEGGGAGGGSSAGGGTGGAGGGTTVTGLPCDVATLLATKCVSCHGTPLSGSAPYAIASRDDLLGTAPGYTETVAQRSLTRMTAATSPMPPTGYPAATAAEISALQAWISAGTPVGSCSVGVDAGPTCASNSFWQGGLEGDEHMKPGFACRACHLGQDFQGQNPTRESKPERAYQYMGTVFPGLHEKDGCNARAPAGTFVDILEPDGGVRLTLPVFAASGNFYGGGLGTPAPYRARVRNGGATVEMQTVQTEGDCNQCHTQSGAGGAAGRILIP